MAAPDQPAPAAHHDDAEAAVVAAAHARAAALRRADRFELAALLHPAFVWTDHRGGVHDRDGYVERNCGGGGLRWHDQSLADVDVRVAGDVAVLTAVATDLVSRDGEMLRHRMPVTLTWVHAQDAWTCLAGHAGPRLDPKDPAKK